MSQEKPIYLYVTPLFPSPQTWRGGFCYDAVRALMRDGRYDVRVFAGGDGGDYEIDGIHVYRFHLYAHLNGLEYLTIASRVRSFANKIKESGIDLKRVEVCHVHLFADYAPFASWIKRRCPDCMTMLHHHWTGYHAISAGKLGRHFPLTDLLYLYNRHYLEAADVHVFCSEETKSKFGMWFPNGPLAAGGDMRQQLLFPNLWRKLKLGRALVAYNGIDSTIFSPRATEKDPSRFVIGCVGHFLRLKSQITLIKAFARVHGQMPGAELKFVGTGPELAACKAFVAEHGLSEKVTFLTEVYHDKMGDFYRGLDLFCLPTRYWEAFCCSYIEAWGCGVPVIGTKGISIQEAIPKEDQDTWLIEPFDDEGLSKKLLWAYRTRPSRQRLTRDFDIDVLMRDFLGRVAALRKEVLRGQAH